MSYSRFPYPVLIGALVLSFLAAVGALAQVSPAGPAIQVDSVAAAPRVAVDALGYFGVLWDKEGLGVGALRTFDPRGRPLGRQRVVSDPAPGWQTITADIAVDGSGGYLAVWHDRNVLDEETALFVRFFDGRGRPRTRAMELSAGPPLVSHSLRADVARNRDGVAVVVWASRGSERSLIRAQRFSPRDEPAGGTFTVAGAREGYVGDPRITLDDLGRFVVVWRQSAPEGPFDRFFFQRYGAGAEKRGARKHLTRDPNLKPDMALAADSGGEFVAVWTQSSVPSVFRVRARWFDPFGIPLSGNVTVRSAGGNLDRPAVARDRFGNTVILWDRFVSDQTSLIEGRVFDRLGESLGEVFRVGEGFNPSVGFDEDGHFVVAWGQTGERRLRPVVRRFRLTCAPGFEQRCSN